MHFADYQDKRVYFCCPGCVQTFQKDPEKYLKRIVDKGEKVTVRQTVCPVMGGKVNRSLFVDWEGHRFYLCCAGCIDKFKADPETYAKRLEAQGQFMEKTPVSEK